MSPAFLSRLLPRKPAAPTTLRMNVCPPDVVARDATWARLRRWLAGDERAVPPSLRTPIERARTEFVLAMSGLVDLDTNDLLRRAQHARSLRELWHLRSELYTLVARRVSQQEADARLARVNRHFPTRTQRSNLLAAEPTDVQ